MGLTATKYKETEAGLIPEDWEVKKLGEVLKIRHGRSQKEVEDKNGIYPILGTGGLMGYANKFLYDKESVLIGRKGTIDKPRYMSTPFWTVDTLFYSEIKTNIVAKVLFYNFQLIDWYSHNEASGVPSLNASKIESIKISLPPTVNEQKAIAQVLTDTEELIQALEKKTAKKKLIKKGTMQKLLTPKKDWEMKSLGEVAEIYTGKKNNQDKVENGRYPFFVRSQIVESINTYSFDGEAILVPGEGNIGKIFHYINGKFDFHQRVYKISNFKDGYNGKYIYRYISEYFGMHAMENSVKATVDSLRLTTFEVFQIPFPPTFEEQILIAKILGDIDKEIENLEQELSKYQLVKQGMLQQLITGKIRLV